MLILGLLGMYFDAAVVFFTISSLLFRMAMAVLCAPNRRIDPHEPKIHGHFLNRIKLENTSMKPTQNKPSVHTYIDLCVEKCC